MHAVNRIIIKESENALIMNVVSAVLGLYTNTCYVKYFSEPDEKLLNREKIIKEEEREERL